MYRVKLHYVEGLIVDTVLFEYLNDIAYAILITHKGR